MKKSWGCWGCLGGVAAWVAFSFVFAAVATGLIYIFGRWGITENPGWGIGATVGLSMLLGLVAWAVGKQRRSKRIQKEHLTEEKSNIVHMIDEVLQEKE